MWPFAGNTAGAVVLCLCANAERVCFVYRVALSHRQPVECAAVCNMLFGYAIVGGGGNDRNGPKEVVGTGHCTVFRSNYNAPQRNSVRCNTSINTINTNAIVQTVRARRTYPQSHKTPWLLEARNQRRISHAILNGNVCFHYFFCSFIFSPASKLHNDLILFRIKMQNA